MIKYYNSSHNWNIFLTFIELLASVLVIYFIAITFGASLFLEDFKQTLFFSLFMTVLCVAPSVILFEHKDPFSLFNRLFLKKIFHDDTEYRCARTCVYAVIGAWSGAIVIPLDWDRWWQEWPISCCIGAILGAVLGILTGKHERMKVKSKD